MLSDVPECRIGNYNAAAWCCTEWRASWRTSTPSGRHSQIRCGHDLTRLYAQRFRQSLNRFDSHGSLTAFDQTDMRGVQPGGIG
jgi:hypothetical protein